MFLSIIAFGLAAALGAAMAFTIITKRKNPRWWIVFAHGAAAIIGLVLLIASAVPISSLPIVRVTVLFFLGSGLLGLIMLSMHIGGNLINRNYIFGHAALGVLGFGFLILTIIVLGP